jgi:nitrite reductase/ring-hydroxylating ferredoxin subunit/uncharacterized membrane protein
MADTAIERVQQADWLDRAGDPLANAVHGAYEAGGAAGQQLKNMAHGTWLGHPLHPVLTDIPIGAWMTAAVLDVAEAQFDDPGYGRAADVAIAVGLAGAAVAAVTGLTDWSDTDGGAKRVGLVHGVANLVATTLFGTSLAMRRTGRRGTGRALSSAGLLLSSGAAYLGGSLVFRERIGVTHADPTPPENWTEVAKSDELAEGQMRAVDANGTAVMLARENGRVCALAEHCSHLGGPLSEGTLHDGTVTCPWHASTFALDDGHVVNGPATHPQPCYQVREHDGRIEVGPPRHS